MSKMRNYKTELKKLIQDGYLMMLDIVDRRLSKEDQKLKRGINFENSYQRWYTESYVVIKQLLPDRLPEFVELYSSGSLQNSPDAHFTIQAWLRGIRANKDSSGKKHYGNL